MEHVWGPLKCGGPCSAKHVRTFINPAVLILTRSWRYVNHLLTNLFQSKKLIDWLIHRCRCLCYLLALVTQPLWATEKMLDYRKRATVVQESDHNKLINWLIDWLRCSGTFSIRYAISCAPTWSMIWRRRYTNFWRKYVVVLKNWNKFRMLKMLCVLGIRKTITVNNSSI